MNFIKEIDKYIKENGIPFRNIEINYNYFPTYFNHAITLKLREVTTDSFEISGPSNYILHYDNKDRLFLEVVGSDSRTKLLIFDEEDLFEYYPKLIGMKVSEKELHDIACINMSTMYKREKIRNLINEKYAKKGFEIEKVKDEYEFMQVVNEDVSVITNENYIDEVNKSIKKVIDYIDYLQKAYQEDIKEYYNGIIAEIKYTPSIPDYVPRKSKDNSISKKERVNEIIPLSERISVLQKYSFKYFGEAYSNCSKNVDYYCFMYKNYEGRPILVLESSRGTSYTRVVYLNKNNDYSKEEFILLSKKYLELSNADTLTSGRVVRFTHTDIENFENNLDLVINGVQDNIKYDYNKLSRVKKLSSNE